MPGEIHAEWKAKTTYAKRSQHLCPAAQDVDEIRVRLNAVYFSTSSFVTVTFTVRYLFDTSNAILAKNLRSCNVCLIKQRKKNNKSVKNKRMIARSFIFIYHCFPRIVHIRQRHHSFTWFGKHSHAASFRSDSKQNLFARSNSSDFVGHVIKFERFHKISNVFFFSGLHN